MEDVPHFPHVRSWFAIVLELLHGCICMAYQKLASDLPVITLHHNKLIISS